MRYRLSKIGQSLGTLNSLIGEYQSDSNAMRYMIGRLNRSDLVPGQYQLETFPRWDDGWLNRPPARYVGTLYKRV